MMNFDNATKAKIAKELASGAIQIAAIITAFGVGKKIDTHYGVSKKEVIAEPEEAPKKRILQKEIKIR